MAVVDLHWTPSVAMGEALTFSFDLVAEEAAEVINDHVMHFQGKAGGLTGRKVFKLRSISLGPGERSRVTKRHPMRGGMTTRQLHPGLHEFQLQINGADHGTWTFTLVRGDPRPGFAGSLGVVTPPNPMPTDPTEMNAWLASLTREDLLALTQQVGTGALAGPLAAFGGFERGNREIDLLAPPAEPSLLTLTIELVGSKPRIWRRLALPGDLTLDAVHTLFQAAMGWTDSHLHRFQPGGSHAFDVPFFITDVDEEEGDEGTHEDEVRLDQVLRKPGDRLLYLYDFGDGWEHRVTLESLAPLTTDTREPACLRGAGACPPEDVGGMHGFLDLAAWLRAGAPEDAVPSPFEDAEHAHGWLPPGYDPDAFDAAEATAAMRLWASGEHLPWHALPEPLAELVKALRSEGWSQASAWLNTLGPRGPVELDEDDVGSAARPWLAVVDAVGPGTRLTAAGYLPPALVTQIAQASGIREWWIGTANREDHTYPVAALREHTVEVGLLRKVKGTLVPTARARAVAGQPRALVGAVLGRLPLGKGFDAEAGWFALLGLAAGVSGRALDAGVALMLTDRGWRLNGSTPVDQSEARRAARTTLWALEDMAGGQRAFDPALMTRLARASLFGVATAR